MFSSGKHEKLTADPRPWMDRLGKRRSRRAFFPATTGASAHRYPRPEFDRPLTNPANPILADFRESEYDALTFLVALGNWTPTGLPDRRITVDNVDHARRVLSRLAALS